MTEQFYKATRLDGSSFHDPAVVYRVDKRVRPKPFDGERVMCGAGTLHASRKPWQAAQYAKGEFRLFVVEGTPYVEHEGDKCGFRQLVVVEEVPNWMAFDVYGHGRQVQAVWERWLITTDDEKQQLRDAQDVRDVWDARAARDVRAVWAARDAWAARAVWAAWDAWAARDAAMAYINPEDIGTSGYTQEHYDVLVGPWESVIGKWDGKKFVKGNEETA